MVQISNFPRNHLGHILSETLDDSADIIRETRHLFQKQLIGGFCCRKRYPGVKRKYTNVDNPISLPNLPGDFEVKFEGRKRACVSCSNHERRNPSGHTPETVYGCSHCGVNLCRNGCFLEFHTENAYTL